MWEESPIPDGGPHPVPALWCILVELEGLPTLGKVVALITCVCLMTQSMGWHTELEYRVTVLWMEQNINTLCLRRHDRNVPCAVCYVRNRTTSIMVPAKMNCHSGWTREYYGYLISAYIGDHYRTQFICMDSDMEAIPGLLADTNGALFYHAEATCNGLSCGPYNTEKELNCVVCTK